MAAESSRQAQQYLVALGSNRPRRGGESPARLLRAASARLAAAPELKLLRQGPVIASAPVGPAMRRFANSAVLIETMLQPLALLDLLQRVEAGFGRQRRRRWGDRRLDCDIILWSGGRFTSAKGRLVIPHCAMRVRRFVLDPAAAIAPDWRDPVSGRTLRQLAFLAKRGKAP